MCSLAIRLRQTAIRKDEIYLYLRFLMLMEGVKLLELLEVCVACNFFTYSCRRLLDETCRKKTQDNIDNVHQI